MKILHTSDIHLDSPLTSKLSYEKSAVRRRELLLGFSRLCDTAVKLCCRSIIIAGDLFDSEDISARGLDTALYGISSHPDISFFYLPGNHEKEAILSSGAALPKNLFVFGEDWTYFKSAEVVIAGRSRIESGMFDTLKLDPKDKNVVVLHGEPTDRTSSPSGIGLTEAAGRGIDYLALGHYHTKKSFRLDSRGVAVYSGAPFARGFDECGERGFVTFDTERMPDFSFIPTPDRRFFVVKCDLTGAEGFGELEARIGESLSKMSHSDSVRLELCGKRSPTLRIDTREYERIYGEGFFHFEIKDSTKLYFGQEDFSRDRTLKGEFVRTVNSRVDLDEGTKERIIEMGLYALLGE